MTAQNPATHLDTGPGKVRCGREGMKGFKADAITGLLRTANVAAVTCKDCRRLIASDQKGA